MWEMKICECEMGKRQKSDVFPGELVLEKSKTRSRCLRIKAFQNVCAWVSLGKLLHIPRGTFTLLWMVITWLLKYPKHVRHWLSLLNLRGKMYIEKVNKWNKWIKISMSLVVPLSKGIFNQSWEVIILSTLDWLLWSSCHFFRKHIWLHITDGSPVTSWKWLMYPGLYSHWLNFQLTRIIKIAKGHFKLWNVFILIFSNMISINLWFTEDNNIYIHKCV